MDRLRIRRRLVKWGNAYGIRVTRKEAERLGLHEKDTVAVEVWPDVERIQVDRLTTMRLGRGASARHDEWAHEAADADR